MRVQGATPSSNQVPLPAPVPLTDPCDPQQLLALGILYGRGLVPPQRPRPKPPEPPADPKPLLRPLEYPCLVPEPPNASLEVRMRCRGLVYFGFPYSRWAPPGSFAPYVEPRPELRRDAGLAQGAGGEKPAPNLPPPKPVPAREYTTAEKELGYGLTPAEREARGLSPLATLRPALPKPAPAIVKELERIVSEPPAPPVRHPAPGTKGAACEAAGHDVHLDETAQRWRCRHCDAERFRKTHPRKGTP